jgi:tRNA pseudouridine55 synthase
MATGMLPLCLDEATKVIAEIESGGKCYEFTVQLGARTDTGDAEGQVVDQQPVPSLDTLAIERTLAGFRGTIQQVPPMYSALKRDGRPLYELARKGIEVERTARTIEIRRLDLVAARSDALDLVCECAKGTYIRVLGEDVARALGTLGHLTRLRRTWVEPFRDMPMLTLEAVLAGVRMPAGS